MFIKYDLDKADPDKINEKFGVRAYPTFIFVDGNGNEINRMLGGARDTKGFIARVEECMKPENSFAARDKKLAADPSYAAEYIKYLKEDCYLDDKANAIFNKLFQSRTIEQNFTKENVEFYKKDVNSTDSPVLKLMLDKSKEVSAVMGKKEYSEFLQSKGNQFVKMQVLSRRFNLESLEKALSFVQANPAMQSAYTKFVVANKANIVDKNIDNLLANVAKSIKKCDTESRANLLSFTNLIPRDKMETYKDKVLNIFEMALKSEKDVKQKENIAKTLNFLKNPGQSNMKRLR